MVLEMSTTGFSTLTFAFLSWMHWLLHIHLFINKWIANKMKVFCPVKVHCTYCVITGSASGEIKVAETLQKMQRQIEKNEVKHVSLLLTYN